MQFSSLRIIIIPFITPNIDINITINDGDDNDHNDGIAIIMMIMMILKGTTMIKIMITIMLMTLIINDDHYDNNNYVNITTKMLIKIIPLLHCRYDCYYNHYHNKGMRKINAQMRHCRETEMHRKQQCPSALAQIFGSKKKVEEGSFQKRKVLNMSNNRLCFQTIISLEMYENNIKARKCF